MELEDVKVDELVGGGQPISYLFTLFSSPFTIEVCRRSRASRCKLGKQNYDTAPAFGYCASQNTYYYGYKLHAVCGLSGVIHSYDITKANVHDINYLNDIKYDYHDCTIIGDRGYISKTMQLNLFEEAKIELEVPHRLNQKNRKPIFIPYAKAIKRIETDFSQFVDQFMLNRNYAKQIEGFMTRIISKISAFSDNRCERDRLYTGRVESNHSASSSHLAVCAHHPYQWQGNVL